MLTIKTATPKPEKTKKVDQPKVTFVQKVLSGETYLVMAQSSVEIEDDFSNLYYTSEASEQDNPNLFLAPPYDPQVLLQLVQTNNTLGQCVEAMEVNIDGTGVEFVKTDEKVEINEAELKLVKSLFDEPYPRHSMIKIRRLLRRMVEGVGYGYLEILRNAKGDIMGWRHVPTTNTRMVKLDAPVLVKRKILRNGEEVEMQLWDRERRFGQRVAMSTMVYYKEFGVERHCHRENGRWESPTNPVPPEKRATELLMIGLHQDPRSPYFLPRWINQTPSVVGSRKAEEQNLEFFDAGGMPPAIIFIQGGTLASEAADQLRAYLSGKNKNKNRAVVVEAQSSSGSLESAGSVQVKVERFGGEKANDVLFQAYDKNAEERVRQGFRLPPLFLGKAADYNFATAITAYMVAEAQVFKPERDLFDELLNTTIIRALGVKTLKVKSKPITLQDVANQLKAMELASTASAVEPESLIKHLNQVTGLDMELTKVHPGQDLGNGLVVGPDGKPIPKPEPEPGDADHANTALVASQAAANDVKAGLKPGTTAAALAKAREEKAAAAAKTGSAKTPGEGPARPMRKSATEIIDLARDYAAITGVVQKREISPEREIVVKFEVDQLAGQDLLAFNDLLASYMFGASTPDLVEIASHSHVH